ncbi:hypothetical protein [Hathewaya histolytica]|nr:hypothetical protein [Hathewaya histolytica]
MEQTESDLLREKEAEGLFDKLEELNEDAPHTLKKVLQQRSGIKIEEFNKLYDLFIKMHLNENEYKGVKAKTKGDILENIIKTITIETKIFDLFDNITNDTNEYDIIIKPSEIANISYNALPKIIYQLIVCECKNYNKPVDVTWVGKFYMLLSMSNIKLGIIFSYEGITGNNDAGWNDAKGLVKKIFLKDGIAIIDISKKELEEIKDGKRLYDVIEEKYNNLVFMTDISKFKKEHIASKKIDEIIDKVNEEVNHYKLKKV